MSSQPSGASKAEELPSRRAIDYGNPAIFKPTWFSLDDINIDLVSFGTIVAAVIATFVARIPATLTVPVAAAIVLPLRAFFPRPKAPRGLVLITGASSGIGAELSYIFAEKGHNLVLVGRNKEQLEAVKNNVGARYQKHAHTIAMDLSESGAAQRLYDRVTKEEKLVVDVLVNNAGLGAAGDTFEQSVELTERMTTLNCTTLVQLTQLFGRDMIERGQGWMLQVSSVGGWMASPGQNLYHATKHYVRAFSEALSVELRAYPGIVNTQLMPGPTHTQFVTRTHAQETVMMGLTTLEDPSAVARAGYEGLRKKRRMVFGSWNDAFMATMMQVMPRSVHLTLASVMNAPLRGLARMKEPLKDQKDRGETL